MRVTDSLQMNHSLLHCVAEEMLLSQRVIIVDCNVCVYLITSPNLQPLVFYVVFLTIPQQTQSSPSNLLHRVCVSFKDEKTLSTLFLYIPPPENERVENKGGNTSEKQMPGKGIQ